MLKTHKYRSLSLLLTLGIVVGQLFPVLADDELLEVEMTSDNNFGSQDPPETGSESDRTFELPDEDTGNDGNDGYGSGDTQPPAPNISHTPNTLPSDTKPAPNTSEAQNPDPEAPSDPFAPVEPQPVRLLGEAEDGKIKVEAATTTAILPADAFIQADLIKDEQRTAILDGLKDSKYSIDGILPIDIFFLVKNPESGTADPIPLPEESTVDLKFSVNKELIQSDKDIDWNSVELVKVTKNDDGKYEKKRLIENKDLKLGPVESEPAAPDTDIDQSTETTEDTISESVQEFAPVQTDESGSIAEETASDDPAEPAASDDASLETTEFEPTDDAEESDADVVNTDESSAESPQAYQGTVTLDGDTQIALTWKNKKGSIIGEIKDTIDSITERFKDLFNKLDPGEFADVTNKTDQTTENMESKLPSLWDETGDGDKDETSKNSNSDLISNKLKPNTGLNKDDYGNSDKAERNPSKKTNTAGETTEYKTKGEETETVIVDGNEIEVTVSYKDNTVPSNANLQVKPLEAVDQADAIDELKNAEIEYDNSLSLDISFVQQEDGKEVEPNGPVKIDFKFPKELLTTEDSEQEADESSLQLIHHEKKENRIIPKVIASAEEISLSDTDQGEYFRAEQIEVDSFSTFTLSWSNYNGNNNGNIRVSLHYVDENNRTLDMGKQNYGQSHTYSDDSGTIVIKNLVPTDLQSIYLKAKTTTGNYPYTKAGLREVSTIQYSSVQQNWAKYYTIVLKDASGNTVKTITADKDHLNIRTDINIVINNQDSTYTYTDTSPRTVYAYGAVPNKESQIYAEGADKKLDENWVGLGIGTASNLPPVGDAVESFNYFTNETNTVATVSKDSFDKQQQNYKNFPDLYFDGVKYTYIADGEQPGTITDTQGYYRVKWHSVHKTNGRNVNKSNAYTNNNTTKNDYFVGTINNFVYHLDGTLILIKDNYLTVTWNVLEPGESEYKQWFYSGFTDQKVKDTEKKEIDQSLSEINSHSIQTNALKALQEKYSDYYYINWYLDENCTIPANENDKSIYQLAKDQSNEENPSVLNLYAKFEKKIQVPTGLNDGNHYAFTLMIGAGLAAMLGLLVVKVYRRMNGI